MKELRASPDYQVSREPQASQVFLDFLGQKVLMVPLGPWEAQESQEQPERQDRPGQQVQRDPLGNQERMVLMGAQDFPERRDALDPQD